jgi:hypothetical protein
METIDWSPMREFMNGLALKLVIGIVIMMGFGFIVGKICVFLKMPQFLVNFFSMVGILGGLWVWAKLFLS